MKISPEINKMLVASTAHIKPETDQFIRNEEVASFSSEYGYVIYTGSLEYDRDEWPHELIDLMQFAYDNKCDYLRLDRDGPTYEDFPVFDW